MYVPYNPFISHPVIQYWVTDRQPNPYTRQHRENRMLVHQRAHIFLLHAFELHDKIVFGKISYHMQTPHIQSMGQNSKHNPRCEKQQHYPLPTEPLNPTKISWLKKGKAISINSWCHQQHPVEIFGNLSTTFPVIPRLALKWT